MTYHQKKNKKKNLVGLSDSAFVQLQSVAEVFTFDLSVNSKNTVVVLYLNKATLVFAGNGRKKKKSLVWLHCKSVSLKMILSIDSSLGAVFNAEDIVVF